MSGPGTLLANRYRLEDRVGGGGMGEVWRATDQVLGRTVAVKLMRSELVAEPGFADRFLAEARTMATIRHRGVVAIHDYHGDAAGAFLVMEYVEGESLAQRLHRVGRLDPARTMSLLAQAAEALQAAHDNGVVHRDIKPGNLLVGPGDHLVLTDFGIARSAATTPLTATGAVIGTPSYLAPEQVRGNPATPACDLYSLGVVGYECVTGRRPFDGENPFEIAMKRLREPPPALASEVPAAVVAVIDRALATEPEARWQSAAALAAAARQAVTPSTDPSATKPASGQPAPTRRDYLPGRAALPPSTPPRAAPATAAPAAAGAPSSPTSSARSPASPPPRPYPVPAYAPAPSPPPPWVHPPPRPLVVTLASVLLLITAVSLLLYGGATLSVLETGVEVASGVYGEGFEPWRGAAGVAGLIGVGAVALTGLIFLLLGVQVYRGRPGARGWSFTLGAPLLCCCAPCWWFGQAGEWTEAGQGAEFADALAAAVPEWYMPLTGLWVVTAAGALLMGLLLLMLPPAIRFFRPPRPAFYYPYYPYNYGYPPHA